MTGQGLKESKDLVDFSLGTPSLLLRNVPKEQQKELTMRFVQSGAIIEFR
jgi:ribosomal protein L7/L12